MSVKLRPVRPTDSARLFAWRNSPQVSAYMYADHQIAPEEHARWFAKAISTDDRTYWIIEKDGAPTGLAGLTGIDPLRRRCEWGYYLAETAARGRGIGAAAKFIVIDYVFERLGFHKLWSEVLLENERAWRSDQSFGFVREALYRDHIWKSGRFQDVVGLGLLESDWAAARAPCADRLRRAGYDAEDLAMEAPAR